MEFQYKILGLIGGFLAGVRRILAEEVARPGRRF
jgi:hypothetical protein